MQIAGRNEVIRSAGNFATFHSAREMLKEVVDLAEFVPLGLMQLPAGHMPSLQSPDLA